MSAQRNGSRNTSDCRRTAQAVGPKRRHGHWRSSSSVVPGCRAPLRKPMWPGCGVRIPSRPAEIVASWKALLDALTASGAAVGSTATFPGGHLDGAVGRRRRDGVLPRGQRVFVLANAVVYGIPQTTGTTPRLVLPSWSEMTPSAPSASC